MRVRIFSVFFSLLILESCALGQRVAPGGIADPQNSAAADDGDALPQAPQPARAADANQGAATGTQAAAAPPQTKRILFIIPNFRSVTADVKLPPTTVKQKFKLVMEDTFDYSAFTETAILAGMGEAETSEPSFHGGWPGYGRYYWHNFADLADGNIMSEFLFPVVTREDPRYYTLGHGGLVKRTGYAVSRLFITRSDTARPTPNLSEIAGNGAAAGIADLYYPSEDRSWTKTGQRWALQVGIDGLSNLVKEFWPDVNRALFHGRY